MSTSVSLSNCLPQRSWPEFKAREAEREAKKEVELAPYIEAAMARQGSNAGPR